MRIGSPGVQAGQQKYWYVEQVGSSLKKVEANCLDYS